MSLLRLAVGMLSTAALLLPIALALPGFNGASMLGSILAITGVITWLVHEYRNAPYGEDVSWLDELDHVGGDR